MSHDIYSLVIDVWEAYRRIYKRHGVACRKGSNIFRQLSINNETDTSICKSLTVCLSS